MDQSLATEKPIESNQANSTARATGPSTTNATRTKLARTGLIFEIFVVVCAIMVFVVLLENAGIL